MNDLRIYIHIPFCKSKCQYCDFNSYDNKNYLIDSYINALCNEIDLYYSKIKNKNITSVFFGGGTPSYIKSSYIKMIIDKLNINKSTEVSIEINPETIDKEKLQKYFQIGINRLSFGVQSLDDRLLKLMGRIHSSETAIKSIKLAKEVGFTNISVDLMFGYPLQSFEIYKKTLNDIIKLDIEHLSCYSLKIEKTTPLHSMIDKKILYEIDDHLDRKMYQYTNNFLKKNNIIQYEISNYSKIGYECKHNVGYWELDEYIGFGISAHSYFDNKRFSNTSNIVDYIRGIGENKMQVVDEEVINIDESKKEFIILGLRLNKGINIINFKEKYKEDFNFKYKDEIEFCIKNNLLEFNDNIYKLTDKGKDLSNSVFVKFI